MQLLGAALAYAVILWYVSTGAILLLNHLPSRTFPASMAAASLVALAALVAIPLAARSPTIPAAYLGFTCGVLVWGWHEMSFFMGYVTGPRRAAGPPSTGWRHFWHAAQTCLYHDAAIALTAAVLAITTWHTAQPVGLATFLALWVMRLSAKLNIFLGVRNLNEDWIPRRLAYLLPYMRHANMNALLPASLLGGTAATAWFTAAALRAPSPAAITAAALIAGILGLAVIEHAFMVIPLPFASLWHRFMAKCPADPSLREALATKPSRPPHPAADAWLPAPPPLTRS